MNASSLRALRGGKATRTTGLRFFLVIGSVTVIGPGAMDIYLPGLPQLAGDLGASPSAVQLTVTTFLVGLALGQFVAGPFSDVYGRRRPLILGMAVFTVTSVLCGLAPNLVTLAALRVVQGATAAAGLTLGRAIVRDLYSGTAAARYLSRLMLVIGLGPVLAPVIGSQILRFTSWRGTFAALALLGVLLVFTSVHLVPETLPPARRRPSGLRETVGTFGRLLSDRVFLGFTLICGLGAGGLIAYVAGSAFVVQDVYGASPQLYGLLFGTNASVMVAGAQINAHLLKRRQPRDLLGAGMAMMVIASAALVAVVLFPAAGLIALMPPLMLFTFSWSFIQSNAVALALTPHPGSAGTAAAVIGISQFAVGAVVAPLVGLSGNSTALPMAIVMGVCAFGAAAALKGLVPRYATSSPAMVAEALSAGPVGAQL